MTYNRVDGTRTILQKYIKSNSGGDPDTYDITPQTDESGPENAGYLKKHQKEAWLQRHSSHCTNHSQYTSATFPPIKLGDFFDGHTL